MQAEIPAEEPQVDAAHPQLCVPADLQPLPACRHQSLPSDVWGTVRHRSYCFCHSVEARWPSEQLQETQIKLLIHYLKDTFRLPSPVMNLARLSWCLIKNSRSLRLKGTLKSLPLIFFFFPQIEVSRLEPEIAVATDCKSVTYNKGLWLMFVVKKRSRGDRKVRLQWEAMFHNHIWNQYKSVFIVHKIPANIEVLFVL